MYIKEAEIEWIGEVQRENGTDLLAVDLSTKSTPKQRYLIYRNKIHAFDLVRLFERGDFKKGDKFDFLFNQGSLGKYSSIWRIVNHRKA
jgi:hypothetical protein